MRPKNFIMLSKFGKDVPFRVTSICIIGNWKSIQFSLVACILTVYA